MTEEMRKEMVEAMKTMKRICENADFCNNCPFNKYCDYAIPADFEIEED